jgi:hypothetical protein
VVMTSRRYDVDHALRPTIPLFNELLGPVQRAIYTTAQHDHAHHAFAGTRLVAHKLHPVPIAILRLWQSGEVKSVRPGGQALPADKTFLFSAAASSGLFLAFCIMGQKNDTGCIQPLDQRKEDALRET